MYSNEYLVNILYKKYFCERVQICFTKDLRLRINHINRTLWNAVMVEWS